MVPISSRRSPGFIRMNRVAPTIRPWRKTTKGIARASRAAAAIQASTVSSPGTDV